MIILHHMWTSYHTLSHKNTLENKIYSLNSLTKISDILAIVTSEFKFLYIITTFSMSVFWSLSYIKGRSFLGGFGFSGTAFHLRGMFRFSRIFLTIDWIAIVTELSDCLADTATLIENKQDKFMIINEDDFKVIQFISSNLIYTCILRANNIIDVTY